MHEADVAWTWEVFCRYRTENHPLIPFPELANMPKMVDELTPTESLVDMGHIDLGLYDTIYGGHVR